jgi:hypothetical protein
MEKLLFMMCQNLDLILNEIFQFVLINEIMLNIHPFVMKYQIQENNVEEFLSFD